MAIYSLYTRLGFLIFYLAMKSSFTLLQWTRVTQCARFDLYFSDASTERIYIYVRGGGAGACIKEVASGAGVDACRGWKDESRHAGAGQP